MKIYVILIIVSIISTVNLNRIFTIEELGKYNGEDESTPIYIAIKGVVFDVSSGKDFYGKKGSYSMMAGKDCTKAVAKWSIKDEDLNNLDLSDLTDKQKESLNDTFKKVYTSKYPVVGYMNYYNFKDNNEL